MNVWRTLARVDDGFDDGVGWLCGATMDYSTFKVSQKSYLVFRACFALAACGVPSCCDARDFVAEACKPDIYI